MKRRNTSPILVCVAVLAICKTTLCDSLDKEPTTGQRSQNKNIFLDPIKPQSDHCHTSLGERGQCIPLNECIGLRHIVEGKHNHRLTWVIQHFGCGFRNVVNVCCTERDTLQPFEGVASLEPEGMPDEGKDRPLSFPARPEETSPDEEENTRPEFEKGSDKYPEKKGRKPVFDSIRPVYEDFDEGDLYEVITKRPNRKDSTTEVPEFLGGTSNSGYSQTGGRPSQSGLFGGESTGFFGSSQSDNIGFGSSNQGTFSNSRPSQGFGSSSSLFSDDRRPNGQGFLSSDSSFDNRRPTNQNFGSSSSSFNDDRGFGNNQFSSGLGNLGPQQFNNFGNERPGFDRPSSQGFGNSRPGNERPGSGFNSDRRPDREDRPGSSYNSNRRPDREDRPGSSYNSDRRPEREDRPGNNHNSDRRPDREDRPGSNYNSDRRPNREDRPGRPGNQSGNKKPGNSGGSSGSYSENANNQRPNTQRPNNNNNNQGSKKRPGNNKNKRRLLPDGNCGTEISDKIIGGEDTKLDEFPWMALLHFTTQNGQDRGYGCGGSLISDRYVLTAAHCIKGPSLGDNIVVKTVRLGEYDLTKDKDCINGVCSPAPIDAAVEEIIVHPEYKANDRAQHHDIALIRLRKKVPFSAYVSPICLPGDELKGKDYSGKQLLVSGWGKTANGANGKSSAIKQKVSLPFVTLENCKPFYNGINIRLRNTQMCAGGERARDSCQGDSGGPLMSSEMVNGQSSWFATGIVSFGPEDCGIKNIAGVYTKVSEYVDWILDNMKD